MARLRKSGVKVQPVVIEGSQIARSFWGKAWCHHLESFSDYENRLPRGRSYVRNGSVCHLSVASGAISAKVQGSSLYSVEIRITKLPQQKWLAIKSRCAGKIGSLLDLLQGKLSSGVMEVVTDRENGLFPKPAEITLECSCPDWATMCKHVAAVLYGVGARLDEQPELLFVLRGVDHEELIGETTVEAVQSVVEGGRHRRIAEDRLAEIFGLELAETAEEKGGRAAGGKSRPAKKAPSSPKRRAKGKKP